MKIVLIGFMGTGKTTVGKILAERLGVPFFDTDEMIEDATGLTIAQIFEKAGEPDFRRLESETIRLVGAVDKAVIATGGGAPLRENNMRELERNGIVVLLTASPETILERVKAAIGARPLLKGKDPLVAVNELLREREEAYGRCRHVVATDGLLPAAVAERVLALTGESELK
jgi:shikimate kinase